MQLLEKISQMGNRTVQPLTDLLINEILGYKMSNHKEHYLPWRMRLEAKATQSEAKLSELQRDVTKKRAPKKYYKLFTSEAFETAITGAVQNQSPESKNQKAVEVACHTIGQDSGTEVQNRKEGTQGAGFIHFIQLSFF